MHRHTTKNWHTTKKLAHYENMWGKNWFPKPANWYPKPQTRTMYFAGIENTTDFEANNFDELAFKFYHLRFSSQTVIRPIALRVKSDY